MARGRDFLERFRPVGTPGAAGRRGVPADRVADLAAELEPVLALLDDTQAECAALRRQGEEHAAARRAQAQAQAAAVLADAGARSDDARAAAAAAVARRADDAEEQARADGRREVERVRRTAEQRLPELLLAADQVMRAEVDAVLGPAG